MRKKQEPEFHPEDLHRMLRAAQGRLHEAFARNASKRAEAERQRTDLLIAACLDKHAREQLRAADAALREDEREHEVLCLQRDAVTRAIESYGTSQFSGGADWMLATGGKKLWQHLRRYEQQAIEKKTSRRG
jgi:hypothetical protein